MKIALFYYSTTGNTRLLCEAVKRRIRVDAFDLIDIVGHPDAPVDGYDVIGFATFADEFTIPILMNAFIDNLKIKRPIPAFLLNTYGSITGRTLLDFKNAVTAKGCISIAGISVHTPENYPPMRHKGFGFAHEPNDRELIKIREFIEDLQRKIDDVQNGCPLNAMCLGFWKPLFPPIRRFLSKMEMGEIACDTQKCVQCGMCMRGCPAKAIKMNPFPEISHKDCFHCWKCYNLCPYEAISATKFSHGFRYHAPEAEYERKMKSL